MKEEREKERRQETEEVDKEVYVTGGVEREEKMRRKQNDEVGSERRGKERT